MSEHKVGTREEWQGGRGGRAEARGARAQRGGGRRAAREEPAKLEAEQAQRGEEISRKRRELPWVPVEKQYEFDTELGKKTLAELFDGRTQLLAYNIMYGPDYVLGACPGCTSLADEFD